MKRLNQSGSASVVLLLLVLALPARAELSLGLLSPSQATTVLVGAVPTQVDTSIQATLSGLQEVPTVSTQGAGDFTATINGETITFELNYALEGEVTQAHIHFGQSGVNGGISVFLCTNLDNTPLDAIVPPCPTSSATILGARTSSANVTGERTLFGGAGDITSSATLTGEIVATDVIGPVGQGIQPSEIEALIDAIIGGVAYVNVHSQNADVIENDVLEDNFNSGEIRGQIKIVGR